MFVVILCKKRGIIIHNTVFFPNIFGGGLFFLKSKFLKIKTPNPKWKKKQHNSGRKKNRGNLDPILIAFFRAKNKKVNVLYRKKLGVSVGELSWYYHILEKLDMNT